MLSHAFAMALGLPLIPRCCLGQRAGETPTAFGQRIGTNLWRLRPVSPDRALTDRCPITSNHWRSSADPIMIASLSTEFEGISTVTNNISPMSPQDALIAVTFVTAISDDLMSEKEYREITATVNLLPVFKAYDTDRIDGIIDTVQAFMEEEDGVESLVGLVKSALPDHLYETAYALACDVAAADGSVAIGEMRLLEELRQGLSLDRLNAAAIERGARARHMRP